MNACRMTAVLCIGFLAGCAAMNTEQRAVPAPVPPLASVSKSVAPVARTLPPSKTSRPAVPPPPKLAIARPSAPVSPSPAAPVPPVLASPPALSSLDLESRELAALVSFANRVSTLRPSAQRNLLSAALREFAREPGRGNRLRMALLLSLPGTPINDDARALSFLEPIAAAAGDTPIRQFALLLRAQVESRVREQKRLAQLKEQLDGLRAIERSLNDRDRAGTR